MKFSFLAFLPFTERLSELIATKITRFRALLLLVAIDLFMSLGYEFFHWFDIRAMVLHLVFQPIILFMYWSAFYWSNNKEGNSSPMTPTDYWLLTTLLPSAVGMVLLDLLWRIGLKTFPNEWEAIKSGLLAGTIYFMPLVGLFLGWKWIKGWANK